MIESDQWQILLGPGWKRQIIKRRISISSSKKYDVFYYSPCGKRFQDKASIARFLNGRVNLDNWDYHTGCIQLDMNKRQVTGERITSTDSLDIGSNMLVHRQTSPLNIRYDTTTATHVFQSSQVKPLTDRKRLDDDGVNKPNQVFWEKRFQGIKMTQGNNLFSLSDGMKRYGPDYDDLAIIQGMTTCLYNDQAPVAGQVDNLELVKSEPHIWRDFTQPLCPKIYVSENDIIGQEDRVHKIRKKLADHLSRNTKYLK